MMTNTEWQPTGTLLFSNGVAYQPVQRKHFFLGEMEHALYNVETGETVYYNPELTNGLNKAAQKAGQLAGYIVFPHTEQSDWRDYTGYRVQGPDVERALEWLCKAVPQKKGQDAPHVYHGFVRDGSWCIGD